MLISDTRNRGNFSCGEGKGMCLFVSAGSFENTTPNERNPEIPKFLRAFAVHPEKVLHDLNIIAAVLLPIATNTAAECLQE